MPLLVVALLAVPAASAGAVSFGPDLTNATPNYGTTCGLLWAWQGCTVQDPLFDDMELVLPDPVVHGNQTGVVTQIRVKAAATAPAQFVVVEWSGRPNEGNPFPSGVMALSAPVALQPGAAAREVGRGLRERRAVGAANCVGTLRIENRAAGSKRRVTYATGAFAIPAGTTRSVAAKLAKAGRKALKRRRSLTAYANATFQDGRVTCGKITLKR